MFTTVRKKVAVAMMAVCLVSQPMMVQAGMPDNSSLNFRVLFAVLVLRVRLRAQLPLHL